MLQREPREKECDPSALPAQGQESGPDPFIVEPDRFLEELMQAVDEDEASEATSVVDPPSQAPPTSKEPRSPIPSPVPARSERVRYSFD